MQNKKKLLGTILILGYTTCAVISYLITKSIFNNVPNITSLNVMFWGFLGTILFIGSIIISQPKKRKQLILEWETHKKLIITISLLTSFGTGLWAWALQHTNAGTIGLLSKSDIVIYIALGVIFLKEKFSWKSIIGSIIAISGLFLITTIPNEISHISIIIMLIVGLLYAIQSVLIKKSGKIFKGSPFAFLRISVMTSFFLIFLLATNTLQFPPLNILILLISAQIFGAYLGRIFYFEAHKHLGIGHLNLLSLTQLPILLFATWLLLNEKISSQKIIGAITIIIGIIIITLEKYKLNKKFSIRRLFARLRPQSIERNDIEDKDDFS